MNFCTTKNQIADFFTKALSKKQFKEEHAWTGFD